MARKVSIEKVDGGYIVGIPSPYASYLSGEQRVELTLERVIELLREFFTAGDDDNTTSQETIAAPEDRPLGCKCGTE